MMAYMNLFYLFLGITNFSFTLGFYFKEPDTILKLQVTPKKVKTNRYFTLECESVMLLNKMEIYLNDEKIFTIHHHGLHNFNGVLDPKVLVREHFGDGIKEVDQLQFFVPPFSVYFKSQPVKIDMEGSYLCTGQFIHKKKKSNKKWYKPWSWFRKNEVVEEIFNYESKPVILEVVQTTTDTKQNVPPLELPTDENSELPKIGDVKEPVIAEGTLLDSKADLQLRASSISADSDLEEAVDNDINTVFSTSCPADEDKLEVHFFIVTLPKRYKDLRVSILRGDGNLENLRVGTAVKNATKSKLELCGFKKYQYYCKNEIPKNEIIIYQKGCLNFADIVIYVGADAAPEHCMQADDPKNLKYRGFMSKAQNGMACDDWKNWPEYKPPAIAGPYCRTGIPPDENSYLWCYTFEGWNWCLNPPVCAPNFQIKVN